MKDYFYIFDSLNIDDITSFDHFYLHLCLLGEELDINLVKFLLVGCLFKNNLKTIIFEELKNGNKVDSFFKNPEIIDILIKFGMSGKFINYDIPDVNNWKKLMTSSEKSQYNLLYLTANEKICLSNQIEIFELFDVIDKKLPYAFANYYDARKKFLHQNYEFIVVWIVSRFEKKAKLFPKKFAVMHSLIMKEVSRQRNLKMYLN